MKLFIYILVLATAFIFSPGAIAAGNTFVIGVAPHTSARVILEMYQPLRMYLEKTLNTPVMILTAPDFSEFARRGLNQEYDLAVTTSHQARLLQVDADYMPLLTYAADFKAVALVAADGPVNKPKDLEGKKILGLSPSSQVTLWGQHWLRNNRIRAFSINYVSASDSVARLIISREAAAGFTSLANFQKLDPGVRGQVRILAESATMPGRVYMLNSRRSGQQKRIEAALWGFADTPEAKKYFEANSLGGYRALRSKELVSMDSYADEVRSVLKRSDK